MNHAYILAKRGAGRKWEGVAIWTPTGEGTTCLAFAGYAFQKAEIVGFNHSIHQNDWQVHHADTLRRQKNFREGPMRQLAFSIAEVEEFSNLNRARHYIAQGWDLDSQPEAKAAAIAHGLITP